MGDGVDAAADTPRTVESPILAAFGRVDVATAKARERIDDDGRVTDTVDEAAIAEHCDEGIEAFLEVKRIMARFHQRQHTQSRGDSEAADE